MLTDKALHERKWGRYPSLDKLLGEQPVPSHYYEFSSVSDNVFSQLNRLAEVAVTIREHADSIRAVTDSELIARLPEDLGHLASELRRASLFFTEHAEFVRGLGSNADEQAHRHRHQADTRPPDTNDRSA
jgi:hypothetical protein